MTEPLVHLVRGADPTLRADELAALVERLLAGEDRTYALEEFEVASSRRDRDTGDGDGADGGAAEPGDVVHGILTALTTPPFVTSRRVVVVRNVAGLDAASATALAPRVTEPYDGVYLVLVHEGGRIPAALDKAVKAAKVATVGPASEKTADVLGARLRAAHLELTGPARERVIAHLGEDAGRVPELVALLASAHDAGAQLGVDEVEPYLGDAGTVARWALTDAIDGGDGAAALDALHRLLSASSGTQKALHPMQVMASLSGHFIDIARLDGPEIVTKEHAVGVLGGSPYPAQKKLRAAQRLGPDGIAEAIGLIADADVDLRGGYGGRRAVPETVTVEVLVARLAAVARRKGAGAASSGSLRRKR